MGNTEFLDRQISLIGNENNEKIMNTKVAIFGLGGVGSYVFEMLLRNGVSNILVCDYDKVDITNLNRQLVAYLDTIGKYKVDVCKSRGKNITSECNVITKKEKVTNENIAEILGEYKPDYIVDAVDDIHAKLAIILYAKENNIKCISAMGAGNRTKVSDIHVEDIFKTSYCPLAKKMRKLLKKEGIRNHLVVYSKEEPKKSNIVSSIAEVPAAFGIHIAAYILNDVIAKQ